ncbi:MAG: hypothetical protein DI565_06835 [Ancylobacter novellus]|uniref:Uncharacterized protein n=1 Tax=Ancylobacter novellus TaxID=921 RepID=A0A2W5KJJ3_ANCNO|nr:MAG: hypothetical protein DI565_06835 [Ancylobacter novellus]
MTDASEPAGVDYARALAEAAAYLAARPADADRGSRWGAWSALRPNADLRYPMPALDPARR